MLKLSSCFKVILFLRYIVTLTVRNIFFLIFEIKKFKQTLCEQSGDSRQNMVFFLNIQLNIL